MINFLFRRFIISHFLIRDASSFLFRSGKFSALSRHEAPFNHCKASTLFFSSVILFDHSFVTRVLHGGSTWWFIKDLIPSRSVHRDSFSKELKYSSSCNPECKFFLPYNRRWYYVILDNLSSCFMINILLRMRYFKSINLVIGVILGYISP